MSEETPATMRSERRFTVGVVLAVYNVARYLPDLLGSLERQTHPLTDVQLVFVDDGSTDGGLELLQEWAESRRDHVTVVGQTNAWVAAARNTGIEHLDAEWVTFADPDDVLTLCSPSRSPVARPGAGRGITGARSIAPAGPCRASCLRRRTARA